jgi:hypothetical protein
LFSPWPGSVLGTAWPGLKSWDSQPSTLLNLLDSRFSLAACRKIKLYFSMCHNQPPFHWDIVTPSIPSNCSRARTWYPLLSWSWGWAHALQRKNQNQLWTLGLVDQDLTLSLQWWTLGPQKLGTSWRYLVIVWINLSESDKRQGEPGDGARARKMRWTGYA